MTLSHSSHHTKNEPSVPLTANEGFDSPTAKNHENVPLGSIAKFTSHAQTQSLKRRDEATLKRFKLQNHARQLLSGNRVVSCLRYLIPTKETVDVYHLPDAGSAHYKNLRTCDSVWDCPVCAAKITERKRVELMLGLARAHEDGYHPVLITYTLQHNKGDRLKDLNKALKDACSALKSGRWWQTFVKKYGWVGSILATEVTNGLTRQVDNGWHPHRHELGILAPLALSTLYEMEAELRAQWIHVLARQGYDASWERGLTVKLGDAQVASYVAKWGHEPKDARWSVERELTKAPVKMAHEDGVTPFGLLELYGAGDERAGRLFQEYSEAFHGSKQLAWSNGLRDLLGMGKEKSDEEIAAADEDNAVLLLQLSKSTWWKLLNLPHDVRGELLLIASTGDVAVFAERVYELCGDIVTAPPAIEQGDLPVFIQCPGCQGDAHFLRVGNDANGAHAEFWCRECAESVYVHDLTSAQVVDAEILAEEQRDVDEKPPRREVDVEHQLQLPISTRRVWD